MWWAVFAASGLKQIGGHTADMYLAYALWAAFFARSTANWMYEFMMVEEISSGSINAVLARPIGFYEYYLGQFMGYKLLTLGMSLLPPCLIVLSFGLPTHWERVPAALLLSTYYLIFVHTLSFSVACLAFFINRSHSFTVMKNIIVWMLTGEIVPLDLAPTWLKKIMVALPFSSSVFLPIGYITGRFGHAEFFMGFVNVSIGIAVMGSVGYGLWNAGRRVYSGTGA